MPPMPRRIAALLALAALGAAAGCGSGDPPPLDAQCTVSPGVIERALARAPQPVTLSTGTRLSECVSHAQSDAELQTAGAVLTRAADDLASRAQRGDAEAAVGLGYLVGAARRGAKRTAGIHAELAAPRRELGAGGRRRRRRAGRRRVRARHAGRRGDRVKLRLFHHRDGARVAYRETGTGPGLVLLHSALPQPQGVGARGRGPQRPLPARPPRPPAPRRLRGPPAPPVHARMARRGDGRVLPRDRGARPARRRPRPRRRGPAARGRVRRARAGEARADAQLPAPAAGARRAAVDVADDDARGGGPRPRPRPQPRRAARVPARPRGEAQRAREPGGARPRPPRVRRRRRQREPRALVGDVRALPTRSARAANCSTRTRGSPPRRCCSGPTRTRCTRSRRPRRRSTCCPTRSCACSAGPGS